MAILPRRPDAIIFTAGIGENSIYLRKKIADGLNSLGVILDDGRNDCRGVEQVISRADSDINLLVVPTNEELMIAMETEKLIGGPEEAGTDVRSESPAGTRIY